MFGTVVRSRDPQRRHNARAGELFRSRRAFSGERLSVFQFAGRPFQCDDYRRIWTEKQVADCPPSPVGDPMLCQMVRLIVQHVAALAERAQVPQPIVCRITVQVCCCEHDAGDPKPSCLHKIGPAGRASSAIPPCRRLFVEPAPVRKDAEEGEMWSATTLAFSSSAREADVVAQLAPVWGIERSKLGSDWYGE
jgi:hypothetical protein